MSLPAVYQAKSRVLRRLRQELGGGWEGGLRIKWCQTVSLVSVESWGRSRKSVCRAHQFGGVPKI